MVCRAGGSTAAGLLTYVYVSYAAFRQHTFAERLARRAEVTQQILALNDDIAGTVLTSLPEQAEQVYYPVGQRVYASQLANDFTPSAAFLVRVRQKGLVSLTYAGRAHCQLKEGVAVANRRPAAGQYVALVTAYDEEGYNQQRSLFRSFLYSNLGTCWACWTCWACCLPTGRWRRLPFSFTSCARPQHLRCASGCGP